MSRDRSDDRVTITIPYPVSLPRQRGIHARTQGGHKLAIRASMDEVLLVKDAAAKAGITESELMRFAVTYVSKEVLKDVSLLQPDEA